MYSALIIGSRMEDGLGNRSLRPCLLVEVRHQAGSALRCGLTQRLVMHVVTWNVSMLLERRGRRGNQQCIDGSHRPVRRVAVRQPE